MLTKLQEKGLSFAPAANRLTLIRRVTFDLTGLPPTPVEVEAFLADNSPAAFDKVIDRLLASQQYGERWGRHWLDLVRYADTAGCNSDFPIPDAFRYRNWVIRAFNDDKPYPEFLREQIAGDLLPADSGEQRDEQRIATGFLVLGAKAFEELKPEVFRMEGELLLLLFRRREAVEARVQPLGDLAGVALEVRGGDPLQRVLLRLRQPAVERRERVLPRLAGFAGRIGAAAAGKESHAIPPLRTRAA